MMSDVKILRSTQSDEENKIYLRKVADDSPIPLKSIHFQAFILYCQAKLVITQEYENSTGESVDTVFIFPCEESMIFSKLVMKIGNEVIETIVGEREEVAIQFQQALKEKKTVLEGTYATRKSRDLFRIRLGNIPAKSIITIEITIYYRLSIEDMCYCFRLPLLYFPRYTLQNNIKQQVACSQLDIDDYFMLKAHQKFFNNWSLKIILSHQGQLIRFNSKNQRVIQYRMDDQNIEISLDPIELNRMPSEDFVLLFQDQSVGRSIALRGEGKNGDQGIILNFIPDFRSEKQKQELNSHIQKYGLTQNPNEKLSPNEDQLKKCPEIKQCDYYFLVDRSGSMVGKRILLTIEALKLFLFSLPTKSRFNIISFGSNFSYLYKNIVDYNENTLQQTIALISKFTASMGGTEILKPLSSIFDRIQQDPNQFTQIFLLTDGRVNDTIDIVEQINKRYKINQRLHTFGIGSGVSTDFIKNIARAGGGMSYFINELMDIEKYVIEALCLNLIPYIKIKNIKFLDKDKQLVQSNDQTIDIPNGSAFEERFFIQERPKINYVQYILIDPNNQFQELISQFIFEHPAINQAVISTCVCEQMRKYQFQKKNDNVIALSKLYQIICPLTSFLAVKQNTNKNQISDILENPISKLSKQLQYKLYVHVIGFDQEYQMTLPYDILIFQLGEKIKEKVEFGANGFRFFNKSCQYLDQNSTLEECGLNDGSILHCRMGVKGGGGGEDSFIKVRDLFLCQLYPDDQVRIAKREINSSEGFIPLYQSLIFITICDRKYFIMFNYSQVLP